MTRISVMNHACDVKAPHPNRKGEYLACGYLQIARLFNSVIYHRATYSHTGADGYKKSAVSVRSWLCHNLIPQKPGEMITILLVRLSRLFGWRSEQWGFVRLLLEFFAVWCRQCVRTELQLRQLERPQRQQQQQQPAACHWQACASCPRIGGLSAGDFLNRKGGQG